MCLCNFYRFILNAFTHPESIQRRGITFQLINKILFRSDFFLFFRLQPWMCAGSIWRKKSLLLLSFFLFLFCNRLVGRFIHFTQYHAFVIGKNSSVLTKYINKGAYKSSSGHCVFFFPVRLTQGMTGLCIIFPPWMVESLTRAWYSCKTFLKNIKLQRHWHTKCLLNWDAPGLLSLRDTFSSFSSQQSQKLTRGTAAAVGFMNIKTLSLL